VGQGLLHKVQPQGFGVKCASCTQGFHGSPLQALLVSTLTGSVENHFYNHRPFEGLQKSKITIDFI
jgi:hypothetical protein